MKVWVLIQDYGMGDCTDIVGIYSTQSKADEYALASNAYLTVEEWDVDAPPVADDRCADD